MKKKCTYYLKPAFAAFSASAMVMASAYGQDLDSSEGEVVELSPFVVDSSDDKGYRATNTISGSRLNSKLKDIPMPIEVITEEFMDDIGATDLRDSLKYSSGILTTSQNDAGAGNSTVGSGGVHNAEGATANKTSTSYKVRGFVTEATLRDGYRRQVASDSINIGRVEVVRGPSALLYGIGNFGGIVNYIPKLPSSEPSQFAAVGLGNNGYFRTTYEADQPLGTEWDFKFRFSAAYEENEKFSELEKDDHLFLSPIITFSPTENTDVIIDYEYGDYHQEGNGFQSVRVNGDLDLDAAANQQDRLEHSGYLVIPGVNHRTMRLSGGDTYLDTDFDNFKAQVTHQFLPNFNILVGMNDASVDYEQYDFGGSTAPANLSDLDHLQFVGRADVLTTNGDVAPVTADIDGTDVLVGMVGRHTETYTLENLDREQFRFEANFRFNTFQNSEKFAMQHNFLLGRSKETFDREFYKEEFAAGEFNYFNPSEYVQLRKGVNSDGTAGFSPTPSSKESSTSENTGDYFVYQGKFLNDRITAIYGRRKDSNEVDSYFQDLRVGADPVNTYSPEQTDYTTQLGLSFEIIPQITLFALKAEGLSPNFEGKRDAFGSPIEASTAESEEIGIKFELFDGKLSGSLSKYKIEQVGKPTSYWWAPAPGKGRFVRDADIVYNVGNFNPDNNGGNGAAAASRAEWDAAVAAGAAYRATPDSGAEDWYLNASTPEGAAYMDSVFQKTRGIEVGPGGELVSVDYGESGNPYAGWAGWLYNQDSLTNNATMDWGSPGDTAFEAFYPSNEESKGAELNLTYQPTDNWQVVFNYAMTEREVTKVSEFPRYPWAEGNVDKWAVWYFPDGSWGLRGAFGPNEAYAVEEDTSTWQAVGLLQGEPQDDTPKHEISFWNTYSFDEGRFNGLIVGLGGYWQDKREFESGITDGAGQIAIDPTTGRPFNKTHSDRLELSAMAKYNFQVRDRDAFVQLNVDNILDDKDRYGWIYAPGMSWKLAYGMSF